jgi:hypothetical protein
MSASSSNDPTHTLALSLFILLFDSLFSSLKLLEDESKKTQKRRRLSPTARDKTRERITSVDPFRN